MSTEFGRAVSEAPMNVYTAYSMKRIVGLIWDNDRTFIEKVWCIIRNEYDAGRRKQECEMNLEMAFWVNKELTLEYI